MSTTQTKEKKITKKKDLILVDEKYLKNKIYIIRGQKVMLDKDLAEIYGYSTKVFNQQVIRNSEKFDEDFMFRLTKEDIIFMRSQFVTSNEERETNSSRSQIVTLNVSNNKRGFNIKYKPYAFTEQGIYMLMTVLRGDLAIKQSKALIRLFKKMKDYIVENRDLLPLKELETRTSTLENDVKEIKTDLNKVMDNFIDPSTYKHFLILDGQKLEADLAYKKIFRLAKKSIIYIDDYIGIKTLDILSYAANNIVITIISDNKANPPVKQSLINDFISQNKTNKLTLLKSNNKIHDRFIILDFNTKNERIYHCGSSLKDAGNKITTIQKIEDPSLYNKTIKKLLKHKCLII